MEGKGRGRERGGVELLRSDSGISLSCSSSFSAVRLDPDVEEFLFPEDAGTVFLFNIVEIVETELDITIDLAVRRDTGDGK